MPLIRRTPVARSAMVRNVPISSVRKDGYTGKTFGQLTVVNRVDCQNSKVKFLCVCSCGREYVAESYALRTGVTWHCGCNVSKRRKAATTHGKRHSRVYYAWKNMMNRCYVGEARGYENYGGRGISVVERWHTFENFYQDMGDPGEGMTLERREGNQGYCKNNCCWATWKVQAANRRNTLRVEYKGAVRPLVELAEECGIPYKVVHQRIATYGMSIELALSRRSF